MSLGCFYPWHHVNLPTKKPEPVTAGSGQPPLANGLNYA